MPQETKDCIFCKIARKEIPSDIIYEDEDVMAFLDIKPINRGHALVMPKKHFANLLDLPDTLASEIVSVAKKIGFAQLKSLKAEGFNMNMNNFPAAGQLVMHAHIHVIPRFSNDGLKHWPHSDYPTGEAKKFAEKLRKEL